MILFSSSNCTSNILLHRIAGSHFLDCHSQSKGADLFASNFHFICYFSDMVKKEFISVYQSNVPYMGRSFSPFFGSIKNVRLLDLNLISCLLLKNQLIIHVKTIHIITKNLYIFVTNIPYMGKNLFCQYLTNLKSYEKNKAVLKSASEGPSYMLEPKKSCILGICGLPFKQSSKRQETLIIIPWMKLRIHYIRIYVLFCKIIFLE